MRNTDFVTRWHNGEKLNSNTCGSFYIKSFEKSEFLCYHDTSCTFVIGLRFKDYPELVILDHTNISAMDFYPKRIYALTNFAELNTKTKDVSRAEVINSWYRGKPLLMLDINGYRFYTDTVNTLCSDRDSYMEFRDIAESDLPEGKLNLRLFETSAFKLGEARAKKAAAIKGDFLRWRTLFLKPAPLFVPNIPADIVSKARWAPTGICWDLPGRVLSNTPTSLLYARYPNITSINPKMLQEIAEVRTFYEAKKKHDSAIRHVLKLTQPPNTFFEHGIKSISHFFKEEETGRMFVKGVITNHDNSEIDAGNTWNEVVTFDEYI